MGRSYQNCVKKIKLGFLRTTHRLDRQKGFAPNGIAGAMESKSRREGGLADFWFAYATFPVATAVPIFFKLWRQFILTWPPRYTNLWKLSYGVRCTPKFSIFFSAFSFRSAGRNLEIEISGAACKIPGCGRLSGYAVPAM